MYRTAKDEISKTRKTLPVQKIFEDYRRKILGWNQNYRKVNENPAQIIESESDQWAWNALEIQNDDPNSKAIFKIDKL